MELTITNINIDLTSQNIERIKQKTRRMFHKLYDQVQLIKVTLNDVNGPKGGKDKHCKVVILAKGMRDIVIKDSQTSIMSAVNIALSRARLCLVKKVKRKQKNYPDWSPKDNIELSTLLELERNNLVVR